jgi:branched-chain amino acid transport system substrate-binding protein
MTTAPARADIVIGVPGPMTGGMAWIGEQGERGAGLAVANLNAAGGVLGEPVRILLVDDFCDADQALAAAKKLVAEEVALVAGHLCSGAAIPASKVYEEAGILMISHGDQPGADRAGIRQGVPDVWSRYASGYDGR